LPTAALSQIGKIAFCEKGFAAVSRNEPNFRFLSSETPEAILGGGSRRFARDDRMGRPQFYGTKPIGDYP